LVINVQSIHDAQSEKHQVNSISFSALVSQTHTTIANPKIAASCARLHLRN